MSKETLLKAVELAGGQAPLARGIRERLPDSKISQVHIWGWINCVKMEVPPAEAVLAICAAVGWQVTPHELRPDIYPSPADGLPGREPPAAEPVAVAPIVCGTSDPRHADRRDGDRRDDPPQTKEAA